MIEIPRDKEQALDIVWGTIRQLNDGWVRMFPDTLGCQVREVAQETGWSYSTCKRLIDELVARGQLIHKWNHQHQTYWSGHYRTLNDDVNLGVPLYPDVADIPF